ncbi:MAG TPA: hypothetical protein VGC54_14930 [Planctomycetota bacterium]
MSARTIPIRFALVSAVAVLVGAPATAQDLDRALTDAGKLAAAGKFDLAKARVQEELAFESTRGRLLARYGEVRHLFADWTFESRHGALQPQDLLAGEVAKWKDRNLKATLRWDWPKLDDEGRFADFRRFDDAWLFRVPIGAEFTVEIEGEWNPEDPAPVSILFGVDPDAKSGFKITPGFHRTEVKPDIRMPRRVGRFGEPREVLLETVQEDLEEPTGSYRYTFEVKRGKFTLKKGSKRLGEWDTRFREHIPGLIGFSAARLTRFEVEGELDPASWQARGDERRARLRESFRSREYEPMADMPEWFRKQVAAAEARLPLRAPENAPAEVVAAWGELTDRASDFAEWTVRTKAQSVAGVAEYAHAVHSASRGAWAECRDACTAARHAGLDSGPLMALSARARFHCDDRDGARKMLEAELEKWPDDAGWEFARTVGRILGPREMLKALDRAVAAGGLAPRILENRSRIAEALEGPAGEKSFRHSVGQVVVLSDQDQESAKTVANWTLEILQGILQRQPTLAMAREPLVVLHFREAATRRIFCTRLGLPEDAKGYLPDLRMTLLEGDPGDETEFKAFLHPQIWEHHLDGHMDLDAVPDWFRVGYGNFFQACNLRDGFLIAYPHHALLRKAQENGETTFFQPDQLIKLPRAEWLQYPDWTGCESWLLVHFLEMTQEPGYAGRLGKYLTALREGQDPLQAWQAAFSDLDATAFARALNLHRIAQLTHLR